MDDDESLLSRRSALRVIAAVPAIFLALRRRLGDAQSIDALKLRYHYRKFSRGREKCWHCVHYTRRSRVFGDCAVVQATVVWEGRCSAWQAKTI